MILGFIGTGRITSSVIEGIFKSNLRVKKIYISPRNKIIAKKLSKRFKKVTISRNNQQLIDNSNWVFLAVTPKVGDKILKKLNFEKTQKVISFISTINLTQLYKVIGKKVKIVRAIPLPPISIRKGPIPIEAQKYITSLFAALSEDSVINSKKDLKYLVKDSQTPRGLNEQAVKQLRKAGFYRNLEKSLNGILKRVNKV